MAEESEEVEDSVEFQESVTVQIRALLSKFHRQNAILFRDKAKRIESIYRGEKPSSVPQEDKKLHRAYSMNSVLSSVFFIEAAANEFVEDLMEDQEASEKGKELKFYPDIDVKVSKKIISERDSIGNARPAKKFNLFLREAGLNEFDSGSGVYEENLVLNELRNKLVHFSPEWVRGGPKEYTENEYGIEEDLSGRFELNPLTPEGDAFFPSQCLGYGCAEWACRVSRALLYHFSQRVGITHRSIR